MDEFTGMVFHSAEREVERLERQLVEARQEAAELRRQLAECQAQAEDDDRISGDSTLLLMAEIAELRRQLTEERMRANAAEFAVAQLRADAADLRRQGNRAGYEYREVQRALAEVGAAAGADDPTSPESILDALASLRRQAEHANRWRDNEILAANEARADAADLRRQLAEVQAEIAAFVPMRAAANAAIAEAADLRRQLDAVPVGAIADLYTAYAYAVAGKPAAQQFPQVARWLGILPADDTPHGGDDELLPPNRQTVANVRIAARQRPDILIHPDDFADTTHGAGEGDE